MFMHIIEDFNLFLRGVILYSNAIAKMSESSNIYSTYRGNLGSQQAWRSISKIHSALEPWPDMIKYLTSYVSTNLFQIPKTPDVILVILLEIEIVL